MGEQVPMKHCCEDKAEALRALRTRQRRMLTIVLGVNAIMFVAEASAGLIGRSTALLGDALDMFGDATIYGLTLYALDRGARWMARATMLKGLLMLAFAVGVLVEAVTKLSVSQVPQPHVMTVVGVVALAANVTCLGLLLTHRRDDVNMKSAWICSRNDIIANVSVIAAGLMVWRWQSAWPDIVVGVGISMLFLVSAIGVLREGLRV
jgi:cation diffusion facilitator family transporter